MRGRGNEVEDGEGDEYEGEDEEVEEKERQAEEENEDETNPKSHPQDPLAYATPFLSLHFYFSKNSFHHKS